MGHRATTSIRIGREDEHAAGVATIIIAGALEGRAKPARRGGSRPCILGKASDDTGKSPGCCGPGRENKLDKFPAGAVKSAPARGACADKKSQFYDDKNIVALLGADSLASRRDSGATDFISAAFCQCPDYCLFSRALVRPFNSSRPAVSSANVSLIQRPCFRTESYWSQQDTA